jgi:ribonuclease Z
MDLDVIFVGTGGSVPSARRGLPAVLIRRGGDRILVDCGEGTQRQLVGSYGLPELSDIFITHFHADHWLGLPGLLKTLDLRGRERPLTVYGPPGLGRMLGLLSPVYGRTGYELSVVELEPGDAVQRDDYTVAPVVVNHRGRAYGYVLFEEDRPGRFDAGLAEELGVTPGPDFGRIQRGETVNGVSPDQVIGEARQGRKVVISGDTSPCEALAVAAHDADLLVHEATFAADETERAAQTGHSTASQAAELARDAGVNLLALTHISTRYGGGLLRDEARAVFANSHVPRDFDRAELPYRERGEPELLRWDGTTPPADAEVPADA